MAFFSQARYRRTHTVLSWNAEARLTTSIQVTHSVTYRHCHSFSKQTESLNVNKAIRYTYHGEAAAKEAYLQKELQHRIPRDVTHRGISFFFVFHVVSRRLVAGLKREIVVFTKDVNTTSKNMYF